ncbi:hypothetical protein BH23BAC4_BH23BAC4_13360 [soil metagenome]
MVPLILSFSPGRKDAFSDHGVRWLYPISAAVFPTPPGGDTKTPRVISRGAFWTCNGSGRAMPSTSPDQRTIEDHPDGDHEDVGDRNGEEDLPAERHELIVLEARQRPADPDKQEADGADLQYEADQL